MWLLIGDQRTFHVLYVVYTSDMVKFTYRFVVYTTWYTLMIPHAFLNCKRFRKKFCDFCVSTFEKVRFSSIKIVKIRLFYRIFLTFYTGCTKPSNHLKNFLRFLLKVENCRTFSCFVWIRPLNLEAYHILCESIPLYESFFPVASIWN